MNVKTVSLVLIALLLTSCTVLAPPTPIVTFTKVPPFGIGTAEKTDPIEGRATGVRPGEKIVLYARSGVWWIQPTANEPFTTVEARSVWHSRTHPGSAYAALLVKDGYHPLPEIGALPEKGGSVLAVATVQGPALTPAPAGKSLLFGGYPWLIQQTANTPGGTLNYYDPGNAWTDGNGFLHLRIAGNPSHWTSAEVNLRRSLGYGTYRFVVRDVSHLPPSAVFTMLTWDANGPSRQMNIEISKWGDPTARNCQFVIQPYDVPANTVQFEVPGGPITFMLQWGPGRAAFRAYRGVVSSWDAQPVCEHVFTSGVPSPGGETIHMNLYVFGNTANPLRRGSEVIVEKFEYLP
jgi:hypothetical protein